MHFALYEPNNYYYDTCGYDNSHIEYLVSKFVCCLDAWVITRRNVSGSRVDQMMLEQIRPLVISREVNK